MDHGIKIGNKLWDRIFYYYLYRYHFYIVRYHHLTITYRHHRHKLLRRYNKHHRSNRTTKRKPYFCIVAISFCCDETNSPTSDECIILFYYYSVVNKTIHRKLNVWFILLQCCSTTLDCRISNGSKMTWTVEPATLCRIATSPGTFQVCPPKFKVNRIPQILHKKFFYAHFWFYYWFESINLSWA